MIADLIMGLPIGGLFGLLGAGGSIMIWPLLVFVLGHAEHVALMESLIIVGGIAAGGALPYMYTKQIDYTAILLMGLSGIIGASVGAYLGKEAGDSIHHLVFIVVVWVAAWNMLKPPKQLASAPLQESFWQPKRLPLIAGVGCLIGMLSGFSSIGGGFLLVPALVLFCRLPMHQAIGTSLAIITLNAFSGFLSLIVWQHALFEQLEWDVIVLYTCVGILGSLIGASYAQYLPQKRLRTLFGLMLIVVGCVFSYDLMRS